MRILLLSQYFVPEPADKWQDLAAGLKERGHEVEVLTSFPCYPQGKIYDGYRQSVFQEEEIDGNRVIRVPQIPDHSSSVFKRILYYCSFALSAATLGLCRIKRPDAILVYQSALPIGLAAWVISRLRRAPYVLDLVDLWPESVVASGMIDYRVVSWLIRRTARFVYRGAEKINVITEGYRENLIQMGVPAEKITVIHCWPAKGLFDSVEVDESDALYEGFKDRFTVFYAGTIGPCQNIQTVLAAARLLEDLPQVQFVLAGDGVEYQSLVEQVEDFGLENVRFLGRRSAGQTKEMYAMADLLLVHLKPSPMSQVSIPSKTFAYMASGRPILMAVEGESSSLVQKHNCGIVIAASNPEEMAYAVREFLQLPESERRRMGLAARQAYTEKYCSDVQIGKVEKSLSAATLRTAA